MDNNMSYHTSPPPHEPIVNGSLLLQTHPLGHDGNPNPHGPLQIGAGGSVVVDVVVVVEVVEVVEVVDVVVVVVVVVVVLHTANELDSKYIDPEAPFGPTGNNAKLAVTIVGFAELAVGA